MVKEASLGSEQPSVKRCMPGYSAESKGLDCSSLSGTSNLTPHHQQQQQQQDSGSIMEEEEEETIHEQEDGEK